ncbi:MAG: cytochrome c maturation protein CcmE [Nannocystaceae bacterium]
MALRTNTRISLVAVAASAALYLVLSDSGEGVLEYAYVDQVMASPEGFQGREIKVHGIVVPGTVKQRKNGAGDYRFVIEHGDKQLAVHFGDMVPDTFTEGGEVVLTGTLDAGGASFEATSMSAKCPSKYEEKQSALPEPLPRRSDS